VQLKKKQTSRKECVNEQERKGERSPHGMGNNILNNDEDDDETNIFRQSRRVIIHLLIP
jgi:hypothetical protein